MSGQDVGAVIGYAGLPRRVRMQSVMDDVPAGKATEAVNNGHPAGDCLRACVASVFDLDLDDVPHFTQYIEHPAGTDRSLWYWALVGFGAAYGWRVDYVPHDDEAPAPRGWTFADGKSQRGHSHVVVCHDGKLLHDPHPSDAWLVRIDGWFTLERLTVTITSAYTSAEWVAATVNTYICGPRDCPSDPAFEHDNYYGCVPRDFSPTTGQSKSRRQAKATDGRYRWNGGCDAARRDEAK